MEPAAFFDGHPLALSVHERVTGMLAAIGPVEVRVTRSQVAFRRRRGFAWLWLPGRWLSNPRAEVVLSLALDHRDDSPRWKEVVHPGRRVWMHHLEVHALEDLDDEVRGWLRSAYEAAT